MGWEPREYYTYILANWSGSVLYVGMTGNLEGRVRQHKEMKIEGFTQRYRVTKLVHYEIFNSPYDAIAREKQIKGWSRSKKNALVFSRNPEWKDLSKDWG